MLNVVGLCLVVTSLFAVGFWSPNAPKTLNKGSEDRDTRVKEGHRVVVVEYDQEEQPVTKVSISPEAELLSRRRFNAEMAATQGFLEEAKEKLKEASNVLPNLGQGLSAPPQGDGDRDEDHRSRSPKELICDAYRKCKHKIAEAMGRTKETVSEAVVRTKDMTHPVEKAVSGAAHEAVENTRRTARRVEHAAEEAYDKAKEMAHEAIDKKEAAARWVKHAAGEAYEKAKETVWHEEHDVEEKKKETARKIEHAAEEAYDKAKEGVRHKAREAGERARKKARDAKDLGKTVMVDVAKNVSGFFAWVPSKVAGQAGAVARVVSPEALNSVSGVVYMLAFSTAYGTAVWVTFVLSHVLAGALPRQQFGVVQSKVYPVYFRTMAWAIATALLGYVVSDGGRAFSGLAKKFQVYNLLASFLMVLVNMLYLEPRATKVMFERMKVEKEEGRGREQLTTKQPPPQSEADHAPSTTAGTETPDQQAVRNRAMTLNGRLKKLNTWSSFLNILSLMALSWHVYYLGNRLHLTY